MKLYNFAVSNYELIEEINNSLFRKLRLKAFASGANAHTLPVEEEVLKRGAKTIYDKPIVWRYNVFTNDAMSHEEDEVPCGFIKESADNPIRFERENDGRLFIIIDALIWTRYCGNLIEIFERDGSRKNVSIEIAVIGDEITEGNQKVDDFVIAGITILGEGVKPACKGSHAVLLKFAEDKDAYLHTFAEGTIKINNSKEAAVSGKWENPRRKLFEPISKASNRVSLLKEAYLVGNAESSDPVMSDFKYPHHIVRDGELILQVDGVIAAFQRASQQGIVSGKVKQHLLRHYKELGLSTENFAECDSCHDKNFSDERVGDIDMEKHEESIEEKKTIVDETVVEHQEGEPDKTIETHREVVTTEEGHEDEVKEGSVGVASEHMAEEEKKPDETKDETMSEEHGHEEKGEIADAEREIESIEEARKRIAEKDAEIAKLREDNAAYMAKIDSMSDYEDLKKYRDMAEEEKKKQELFCKMNDILCDIESRGINFSEEEKQTLIAKMSEFDSIDAATNFAKATVLDSKAVPSDGVVRMGLPYSVEKKTSSIWDTL